jgi:hypothetical protein
MIGSGCSEVSRKIIERVPYGGETLSREARAAGRLHDELLIAPRISEVFYVIPSRVKEISCIGNEAFLNFPFLSKSVNLRIYSRKAGDE